MAARAPRWSCPTTNGSAGSSPSTSYRQIAIIDADSGDVATLELDFPDGYTGWPGYLTGVSWLDEDHLAVPTARVGALVPDLAASQREGTSLAELLVDGVSIFDDSGNHVTHLPINEQLRHSDQPDVTLMWRPTGLVRDGRFLLVRSPDPDRIELVAVDLSTGAVPPSGVVADVTPPPPDGTKQTAWPFAWLPDDRVLVDDYPQLLAPRHRAPDRPLKPRPGGRPGSRRVAPHEPPS